MQEKKEENLTNIQLADLEDKFDDNNETWTESYLVDRLKQRLATVEDVSTIIPSIGNKSVFDKRKYHNQAHNLLIIGACNPVPSFIIYLSDLSSRLTKELHGLEDDEDRNYVLHQAVGRIFEDLNFELYHNSISRVLKVELRP
jgi:hypothetical protein